MLKTFFFNIYSLSFNFSFYLFMLMAIISFLLIFTSLRNKFFFFILIILIYSTWGFLLDLDGMMLVLLTTEFTIILLFLMTYIQLYSNYSFVSPTLNYKYLFILLVCVALPSDTINVFFFHTNYYQAINHVVSSDFFILYYFLFEKFPILVILMTLIISFFSLFFILVYYSMKAVKLDSQKNLKSLYFLRKQTLVKQTSFKTKIYTFQN